MFDRLTGRQSCFDDDHMDSKTPKTKCRLPFQATSRYNHGALHRRNHGSAKNTRGSVMASLYAASRRHRDSKEHRNCNSPLPCQRISITVFRSSAPAKNTDRKMAVARSHGHYTTRPIRNDHATRMLLTRSHRKPSHGSLPRRRRTRRPPDSIKDVVSAAQKKTESKKRRSDVASSNDVFVKNGTFWHKTPHIQLTELTKRHHHRRVREGRAASRKRLLLRIIDLSTGRQCHIHGRMETTSTATMSSLPFRPTSLYNLVICRLWKITRASWKNTGCTAAAPERFTKPSWRRRSMRRRDVIAAA
ncbi:hypothetical protein HPB51_022981 [Rhipicephalus microplus]|uniref:Uncharacterized protein n=1 Tax=Rhipicephalus microplus TaxID=6941 RepID=A0A9J6DCT7_RHIMP|nr:hypothetical protein HPB51_022981 [Rhipicephalus microplus]